MFQITVDVGNIYILFHALVKKALFGKFYIWVTRRESILTNMAGMKLTSSSKF
jgi:hypothetical protein